MTRQPTRYRDCVNTFESPSRIPPTEVGGWFRSNLHASTHRVLESHQRKLVDCSDPASETKRPSTFKSVFSFTTLLCGRRLDLIRKIPQAHLCRPDLNNPPTFVGGISEFPHNLYRAVVLTSWDRTMSNCERAGASHLPNLQISAPYFDGGQTVLPVLSM